MSFRYALQKYIDHPENHEEVLFYDDNVTIIKDLFPKSLRHYLVLPRNKQVSRQHPQEVFNRDYDDFTGQQLYNQLQNYCEKAKDMIIEDLIKVLNICNDDIEKIADLKNFIQVGFHTIPSLSNLHIHVITKDFNSPKMKHKKHYNSFTTSFFINYKDLNPKPTNNHLDDSQKTEYSDDDNDSQNTDYSTNNNNSQTCSPDTSLNPENIIKNSRLICTYCSKDFQFKFKNLKTHLQLEFVTKFKRFNVDLNKLTPNQS